LLFFFFFWPIEKRHFDELTKGLKLPHFLFMNLKVLQTDLL
jgi:hypothetical protein